MADKSADLTDTLTSHAAGDTRAASRLLPAVYDELRSIAGRFMARERKDHTLQPTALVHEAYLRLVGDKDPGWNGRGHFFAAAAQSMRQILVDQARRKGRQRHGGGLRRVTSGSAIAIESPVHDMLALDEALGRLERSDPRAARVVLLRYFAGLTAKETAAVLGVSVSTVEREWRFARALLHAQLVPPAAG